MKKKILFTAYTLDIGGIETALVTLLNELVKKYDITLVLENKQGIFLSELNNEIKVIEYNPNSSKNAVIRRTINLIKRIKFIVRFKNKFDFAASFATYSKMGSFCARMASKNNALWCHAKYSRIFNNQKEMEDFFKFVSYEKFKNIIFVSKEGAEDFAKVFPEVKENIIVCNNLINNKKILDMSNERIELQRENFPTFLNVGRQEEKQKRLTRIIEAAKILANEKYEFRILMVGDGPDSEKYKKMVKDNNLEEFVLFVGKKKNPYPYFKISDSVILTSEYEGYPVVYVEAMVLGVPILTTNVSDSKEEIDGKYGIVIQNNSPEEIAKTMKEIIKNKEKYIEKFDANLFNNIVINKIENIINGGENAKN